MGRPEDKYVKIPAIVHSTRVGYTYKSIKPLEAGKDYDADTNIFYDLFKKSLSRINNSSIDDAKAKQLIFQLKASLSGDDLGRAFFAYLQSGIDGYKLIDFDNPSNNKYTVVTELTYENGENDFRPDITFLVNGMPLCFMEVKRQNNKDGILAERDRMFRRFKNAVYRRFVNITQVMAFSNNQEYDNEDRHQLQGSFYASSAYGRLSFNHFREEDEVGMLSLVAERDEAVERFICEDNNLAAYYGSAEYKSSILPETPANRIITSLFSPERLLFILRYSICYVEKVDDEGMPQLQKHVMRYPQLFATKAVRRALDEGRKKGVIWHTQGSGKTALSFFLSRYLRDYYQDNNQIARFFFIVDRLDLADQAALEFRSRGAEVNIVNSRDEFSIILKDSGDDSSLVTGNRTPVITVVNIQKFNEGSTAKSFDYDLNVQRVYFIDEAHRDYKNGGAFLTNLVTSDRNSVKFALTGTPLVDDRKGNATKQVFGDYIHKYFYNQSIADGYTLKLLREDVRTEFKLKMQQVMKELQEIKKLIKLDEVFTHESYVKPLVDYIVDDYMKSQVSLGEESIGGMVVAYSAQQAREIYKCLTSFDPDIAAELILHDEGTKETRREICDSFKKDDSPINILVVYNMLLTGFDAHRLKKLYLCRPIKAHNLLQALTRVNRPYKDMNYGYVVDFADITEEYDKTNRAYLAELTKELGDATSEYSSLFEDPKIVETDLALIKNILFEYTTDNVVEFQNEIGQINDKVRLYELRNALARYKDLRNVAKMHGFEWLYERFDIEKAQELLLEVSNRIQMINNKEALALKDMSTGAVNTLLSQIEFNFRRIGRDELTIADEFQEKLRHTYESFADNIDNDDPEYVNLLDELRRKFEKLDIEEMTSADMVSSIGELDDLRDKIDELNRKDAQLAKKYDGDEKFARAHKSAMRTPPPLTYDKIKMYKILSKVKKETDKKIFNNYNILGNIDFFKKMTQQVLAKSCADEHVEYNAKQVITLAEYIANQYAKERGKVA